MTLEKAIIHAEAVAKAKEREAKENRNQGGWAYDDEAKKCSTCAAEHRQLAEWLKILKSAKFEYNEAWRTITHPTPDVTYADKQRAQVILDKFRNSLGAISTLQTQDVPDTNVGDMVSRQKAIDAINNIMPTKEGFYEPSEVLCKLMQLPSAQPEIIRCKDCKWWSNDDYRECSSPNYDDGYVTPAGFYCGYAERRTDERTD